MAKTIVGELADLYVKYGGSREDLTGKETTAEMIDAIEQIVGGNNDFVVIYTAGEGGTYTADKEINDILAAIEAGKNVKAEYENNNFTLTGSFNEENAKAVIFNTCFIDLESGKPMLMQITHSHINSLNITVSIVNLTADTD